MTCPHGVERTHPIALSTARKANRGAEATAKEQSQIEVNDKRLAIDLCGMRQMVWRCVGQEVGDPLFSDRPPPPEATTKVLWISTKTMLSDAFTKRMDGTAIRAAMDGLPLKVELKVPGSDQANSTMGVKTDQDP